MPLKLPRAEEKSMPKDASNTGKYIENKITAYHHIEKCGGLSMENALRSTYGIKHISYIPASKWIQCAHPSDVAKECHRMNLVSTSGHTLRPVKSYVESGIFNSLIVLRDPSERYISDFIYCQRKRFFKGNFEDWLEDPLRKNHMTKFIAGRGNDVDGAIEALGRCIVAVNISSLQQITELLTGEKIISNKSKPRDREIALQLRVAYKDKIEKQNENDRIVYENYKKTTSSKLYQYLGIQGKHSSPFASNLNHIMSSLGRHFWYKPQKKMFPFEVYYPPLHSTDPMTTEAIKQMQLLAE